MFKTLRYAFILEADRYTHLVDPSGAVLPVVPDERMHGLVGIIGSTITPPQRRVLNQLWHDARQQNPRVQFYGMDVLGRSAQHV